MTLGPLQALEPFQATLWLSTGLDLLCAGVALLLARRLGRSGEDRVRTITVGLVAGAVALTAVFVVAKLALLVRLGLDPLFGTIHLVFLDLVVVLPAVGAGVLLVARYSHARATRPVVALAVLACLAAPVGAYASFVEPFSLRLERASVPLPDERRGVAPIRIGVLSDLQTTDGGEHEQAAVERLMRLRPDLIMLTGDLFQGDAAAFERERPELSELLGRLSAPGGVFFVEGDTDELGEIARVVRGTSVRVLDDEIVRKQVGGRPVTVGGVRLAWNGPRAHRVVRRLSEDPGRGDVRVLVSHRPDAAAFPPAGPRIDLALAGHTHGGQVRLPILGPPMIASDVSREVGAGGLHRIEAGPRVYVSRGVGVERGQAPRVRMLAPPEVSLIELGGSGPAPMRSDRP